MMPPAPLAVVQKQDRLLRGSRGLIGGEGGVGADRIFLLVRGIAEIKYWHVLTPLVM
jgi:hypothetical protein